MKKVVILCPYSYPSACGIWKRVWDDAQALKSDGYNVEIYTSNILKGTTTKLESRENLEGIDIYRFKVWLSMGGTSMFWFPIIKLLKTNADIIHTHGYRHPHSIMSLLIGKLTRKKVLLTTHGPFKKDPRRSFFLKFIDFLYDWLIGWWEIRLYDLIIRVSEWENSHIKKIGRKDSLLIPNGINNEFFENIPTRDRPLKKLAFIGRIDPVKRVEWVKDIAEKLPEFKFEVLGPAQGYSEEIISDLKQTRQNYNYDAKNYTTEEQIALLDKSDIYLFPSIRESFGMTALEAMARGCIVVSTATLGVSEYLVDKQNGYLANSEKQMIKAIRYVYKNWDKQKKLIDNAKITAAQYNRRKLQKDLIKVYKTFT